MFAKQSIHTAYYPKIALPSPGCYNFPQIIKAQLIDVFTQKVCIFSFSLSFSSHIFVDSQQTPNSPLVLRRDITG